MKFATKFYNITHLTLGMLLHYLGKLKIQIFCRYSAIIPDMEENANKLHFKCADFNSSTRVISYAECIYVFLLKSCTRRWIPCWSLANTAVTSAMTNFRCHKLIAKVNKQKNSDMENFIYNQYSEKHAILHIENIKICGSITKPKATKNATYLHFLSCLLNICKKIEFSVSQGSATTCLRWGG